MHNNYFFLKHLAADLNKKLAGMKLTACFSQEKDELILDFSSQEKNYFIKATLRPDFSCINLIENYNRARKNTVDLWPELYGSHVLKIGIFENERAFFVLLDNEYQLVFKLFGNRPNLLIFQNSELKFLFNNSLVSDNLLKLEEFNRPLNIDFNAFANNNFDLQKTIPTLGKTAVLAIEKSFLASQNEMNWQMVLDFLEYSKKPVFYVGKISGKPVISLFHPSEIFEQFDDAISAINAFYSYYQKEFYFFKERELLIKSIEAEIKKTKSYLLKTTDKFEELKSGLSNEKLGHILMANLHVKHEDEELIILEDFYNNEQVKIKLRKGLSLLKNAELYYRKSKNEKIEFESLSLNIDRANKKLEQLDLSLKKLLEVSEFKELKVFQKTISKESDTHKPENPFRVFKLDNWDVWVGKNSKNNDLLTQKYAQKEDFWLHARDTSGSHVVVKNPLKLPLPDYISEQVASIAAFYSKRSTESLVPVILTQKKFVRKTRNLLAGQVIVEKEKVLIVPPQLP